MDDVMSDLKGLVNSLNIVILFAALSFLFRKLRKNGVARLLLILSLSCFLLFSTGFLPGRLIRKIELSHPNFRIENFKPNYPVYIHVLGGGYTIDKKLTSTHQLSMATLGRLAEAIRISHLIAGSKIVCSGNITSGKVSMAQVCRQAAVSLGIDNSRIVLLDDPATTKEEAKAFSEKFGNKVSVIVVTDALHMPRAITYFRNEGLDVYAAPTNYNIKAGTGSIGLGWFPSVANMVLMDKVIHEFFGTLKGLYFT